MSIDLYGFPNSSNIDTRVFNGNSNVVGGSWHTWVKPRGISMVYIFMVGAGGGGGDSVVGAASLAAGGGGGGCGGQASLLIGADFIPNNLYFSIARGGNNNTTTSALAGFSSYCCISHPQGAPIAQNTLLTVNAGAGGGKSSGSTPGPLGTAGAITNINTCLLAGGGIYKFTIGLAGVIGSNTAGAALSLPTSGLICCPGTGGAGNPAANTAGNAGGLITGIALSLFAPVNIPGGAGGATTPTAGSNGISTPEKIYKNMPIALGGTGGGSTGISATPSGSTGGDGGSGGVGSGGGGGGGGFTGQAIATGGGGGESMAIIVAW